MNIILSPFIWYIEIIFKLALNLLSSPGVALILLSFVITLSLMPVQQLIDYFNHRVAPKKAALKTVEEEIERVYTGQTRYMYLQTLYRQHGLHPALNLISLALPLLQLPFFLAAYAYLSKLSLFNAASFLAITDLSRPDSLIHVLAVTLNLLPFIMLTVNLLNVELGQEGKKSSALYYMALAFFIILYSMPSALVLYWTMNNIFQLLITIIRKKDISPLSKRVERIIFALTNFKYESRTGFLAFFIFGIYLLVLSRLNPTPTSLTAVWSNYLGLGVFAISLVHLFFWNKRVSKTSKDSSVWMLFMMSTLPVVHYAYENIAYLNNTYILEILGFVLLPSFVALKLVSKIQARLIISDLPIYILASLVLSYLLNPIWLFFFKVRVEEGLSHHLLLIAVVIFFVLGIVRRHQKLFANIVLVLFLVTLGRFSARYIKRQVSFLKADPNIVLPAYLPAKAYKKPDVYFLIYDAYIEQKVSDYFGVDNREQFDFLRKNGFKVYENRLSQWRYSMASDSALLNFGSAVKETRRSMVGYNPVDRWFRNQGYQTTYYANDYFFQQEKEIALGEIVIPNESVNFLLQGIRQGEFKFETIAKDFDYEKWKRIKRDILVKKTDHPRFVFIHSSKPGHTQDSGSCLPTEVELFRERLKQANEEMKQDVELILNHHPDAIIITAGDHGVYFTGDCSSLSGYKPQEIKAEYLLDRFGVHVGIRWPDARFEAFDDFVYLQSVMLSVIGYLGQSTGPLKHQNLKEICYKGVCFSNSTPLTEGPNKGELIFDFLNAQK